MDKDGLIQTGDKPTVASGRDECGNFRCSVKETILHYFDRFAGTATRQAGSPVAFVFAVTIVIVWGLTGPIFDFSETWATRHQYGDNDHPHSLWYFLIQQSQNKDSVALHLKLNELLASHKEASNHLVSIEDLDEDELRQVAAYYHRLAALADKEGGVKTSHSMGRRAGKITQRRHEQVMPLEMASR